MKFRLIIFFTLITCVYYSCHYDGLKNTEKKFAAYGIVLKKYCDDNNHGITTIVYKNKDGVFEYDVEGWSRNSDFWEYLQIGDSIIKPADTLVMRVKKNNGEFQDFQYNLNRKRKI